MIYIDDIEIPDTVNAGEEFLISVALHEEYENAKKYGYRYGCRYGEKEE